MLTLILLFTIFVFDNIQFIVTSNEQYNRPLYILFTIQCALIMFSSISIATYVVETKCDLFLSMALAVFILSGMFFCALFMTSSFEAGLAVIFSRTKQFTEHGFANIFAYVCSCGIVCACIYWKRKKLLLNKFNLPVNLIVLVVICMPPLLYMWSAKSKGAFLGLSLSLLVLYATPICISISIAFGSLSIALLSKEKMTELAILFFSYGRTLNHEKTKAKITHFLFNRFEAADFFRDPIQFLYQHPFGVNIANALGRTVEFDKYEIQQGIHSLIFIFIEAYGMIAIILFLTSVLFIICRMTRLKAIGLILLFIPMLVTNQPILLFSVLIVMLFSSLPENALHEGDIHLTSELMVLSTKFRKFRIRRV